MERIHEYREVEVHGNEGLVWCGLPHMADDCHNRLNLGT